MNFHIFEVRDVRKKIDDKKGGKGGQRTFEVLMNLSDPAGKSSGPTFLFYSSSANGKTDAPVLSWEDFIALV